MPRCIWCGKTYEEHDDPRPENSPVPRVPCLMLKSGFKEQSKPTPEQIEKGTDLFLEAIYIRAVRNNKWGSYNLKELMEGNQEDQEQVSSWLFNKILKALDLKEGEKLEKKHIVKIILFLENAGIMITRLKN